VLERLLTEQANPASEGIDTLATGEILHIIQSEDRTVADAVGAQLDAIGRTVDAIVAAMEKGGRLFYIGAGTSGRLGVLDASECPPTFGAPPELVQGIIAGGDDALAHSTEASEDDAAMGAHDLKQRGFTASDVLVGIAASGRTPYVLGAIAEANRLGAVTAGISCTPGSELARVVKIAITPLTGPEVMTGSTRMKAGTATKMILNMLTTASFIRLGYVYGNLMVNIQPKNAKLLDRARRIVTHAGRVSDERAAALLEAADNDVRTAIVMARTDLDCERARERLKAAGGRISVALGEKHG
jgi:N-acetylmuramic acid 6-phosphate etherase